ncbi:[FeFe] hydrogenase H-cluster radical SAM maturase HydE [Ruminococcus albus]|uniref:Iron-only hydrogenase maturation protein HydE n=1 Tax=Ruminococcus albus TaxID=1264 RepID=A0A1H7K2E6_RUMAL|nr:[FeFe] hydrogenase H-cluster radical SAM maturase HydE [Ruminococcus albus]SEK80590.1 iron-only hydrogenase maturation protein HydE [Ruminococcus albus]
MSRVKALIDKLNSEKHLEKDEWVRVLSEFDDDDRVYAADIAREISTSRFGNKIFIRGIVEFSNVCKNDCYYCGIRRSNTNVQRYRLTADEILECCDEGYGLGFRTFVLQSGEDKSYTNDVLCDIVRRIKAAHPDCAVTLSLGELSYDEYKALREAGADRYLLRHETADKAHYEKLHPAEMSWDNRMECLKYLKELGYQTGAGIMVGSPYQTMECIAEDMLFFESFKPEMIGIGPFLPHKDTPFRDEPKGSYELTLFLLSLCRILLPDVLLPATTALGTIRPNGREEGVKAGANVIMPNLSPTAVRKKYMLYDNKICTGDESAQCRGCLEARMKTIGYEVAVTRGDHV